MLKVTYIDEGLLVQVPYMPKVHAALKRIGSTEFSHKHKGWIMQRQFEDLIKKKLVHYFGAFDDDCAETTDVEITFKREIEVRRRPVTIAGRIFARAYGRDTGACVGTDIALLDGEITSGGSHANWTSIVKPGAKFKVLKLYTPLLDEFINKPDDYDVEIISRDTDEPFNTFYNFLPFVPDDLLVQECIRRELQLS